jgi:hypothetical protein
MRCAMFGLPSLYHAGSGNVAQRMRLAGFGSIYFCQWPAISVVHQRVAKRLFPKQNEVPPSQRIFSANWIVTAQRTIYSLLKSLNVTRPQSSGQKNLPPIGALCTIVGFGFVPYSRVGVWLAEGRPRFSPTAGLHSAARRDARPARPPRGHWRPTRPQPPTPSPTEG